jgi:hypothetical protein
LAAAQIEALAGFGDRCFLEPNVLRRPPRENALHGSPARPEQFPKPSEIDGFGHVVEE